MTSWTELYGQHQALRPAAGNRAVTELRGVLRKLSEQPGSVIDANAHQRLQPRINRETGLSSIELFEDLHPYAHPGFDRSEIHLVEARLTIQLLRHYARDHLHQLTIMVEGVRREGGPWVIAVHLPDDRASERNPGGDRQGHGACGHAALHAHVGPTMNDEPKVRVPLPGLGAGQLLEWVLSQVVPTPDFEAAPWMTVPPLAPTPA